MDGFDFNNEQNDNEAGDEIQVENVEFNNNNEHNQNFYMQHNEDVPTNDINWGNEATQSNAFSNYQVVR